MPRTPGGFFSGPSEADMGDDMPLLAMEVSGELDMEGLAPEVADLLSDKEKFRKMLSSLLSCRGGVPVEDRIYHITKYEQCFVGFVMVEWFMHHGYVNSREHGEQLGKFLLRRGYIAHVTRERDFLDDYYFYRWNLDRHELFEGVEVGAEFECDEETKRFKEPSLLSRVPIAIYTAPMGTAGIALLWRKMWKQWPEYEALEWIYGLFLALAIVTFTTNTILYLLKTVRHPRAVLDEWIHPATCNLFSTVSITLLNIAVGLMDVHMTVAEVVWWVGTILQSVLAVESVASWINRGRQVEQFNPTYFLPVVGLVLVPMVGRSMEWEELVWCYWGVGVFYWIVLFPIFFMRVVFVGMLPPKVVPSLFIAMAPPALIANSYMTITGKHDTLTIILNAINFFLFVLVVRIRLAQKSVPFSLAWWAYVFPLAATATAALSFATDLGGWVPYSIFVGLAVLANGMWLSVFVTTGFYLVNFRLFLT